MPFIRINTFSRDINSIINSLKFASEKNLEFRKFFEAPDSPYILFQIEDPCALSTDEFARFDAIGREFDLSNIRSCLCIRKVSGIPYAALEWGPFFDLLLKPSYEIKRVENNP